MTAFAIVQYPAVQHPTVNRFTEAFGSRTL